MPPMRFRCKFQSTHPGGVRLEREKLPAHHPLPFQSTHPGGVRQIHFRCREIALFVSIHAPGWGATMHMSACGRSQIGFNPRTRVGCDIAGRDALDLQDVSIHAPGWGATTLALFICCAQNCFNPRTRVGCDYSAISGFCFFLEFQSTHPGGVRPVSFRTPGPRYASFNPRTRVGCDGILSSVYFYNICFNPRTRVGCDGVFVSYLIQNI